MATASEFVRSMNGFSGVDIKATFGRVTIGELQAISVAIQREKAPIYTMGSPSPRAFARGKRGIAGTLVFVVFDRNALLTELNDMLFQSDTDDLRPEFTPGSAALDNASLIAPSGRTPASPIGGGIALNPVYESGIQQEAALNNAVWDDQAPAIPWYADQIPPFNIVLSCANEYGALAVMKIFGVELLNEGWGISIDDMTTEMQYTYVAREVLPLQWVRPNSYFVNRPTES